MRESRFNLLSAYNDDATGAGAEKTRQVAFAAEGDGQFKVPTLRNLMLTGPYGHDGEVDTLAEVMRRHAADGQPAGAPSLTPREQTDLVVFLESLSTFSNPWRPEEASRCD